MTQSVSIAQPAQKAQVKKWALDSGWGRSLLQLAAVVAFFAIWEGAAPLGWVSNFLVGPPAKIFHALLPDPHSGQLLTDTGYTRFETIPRFSSAPAVDPRSALL